MSVSNLEAKKVLKKAKQLKQLDLKGKFAKKVVKRVATEEEMAEARKMFEEQRLRKVAERLAEKEKRREERLSKLREQKEQRRLERLRKLEWLKPREDLLCEDSKVGEASSPRAVKVFTRVYRRREGMYM